MDTGARLFPGEVLVVGGHRLALLEITNTTVLIKPSWGDGTPFEIRSGRGVPVPNAIISIFQLHDNSVTLNINDHGRQEILVDRRSGEVELHIYIADAQPDFEFQQIERIQYAAGAFLEEFGFEAVPEHDPMTVFGSWDWRMWFQQKKPQIEQELGDAYAEMKESLRLQHVDTHAANVFSTRATAAHDLIGSLEPYEEVVVRFGDVLLVKATVNGKSRLIVENVTPALSRQLAANPLLTRDPHAFFTLLSNQSAEHQADPQIIAQNPKVELEHAPPETYNE
ncbi:MAG TPA: hypothetical protein VGN12_28120 [Pirellulales bacterium]|jgi:hypothetical protein